MTVATIDTSKYLTCSAAAKKLRLSSDSVRKYCNNARDGKTPFLNGIQVGREWLIHKDEIERYKRERTSPGRPARD